MTRESPKEFADKIQNEMRQQFKKGTIKELEKVKEAVVRDKSLINITDNITQTKYNYLSMIISELDYRLKKLKKIRSE